MSISLRCRPPSDPRFHALEHAMVNLAGAPGKRIQRDHHKARNRTSSFLPSTSKASTSSWDPGGDTPTSAETPPPDPVLAWPNAWAEVDDPSPCAEPGLASEVRACTPEAGVIPWQGPRHEFASLPPAPPGRVKSSCDEVECVPTPGADREETVPAIRTHLSLPPLVKPRISFCWACPFLRS